MVLLCWARLLVQLVPLRWWRSSLGQLAPATAELPDPAAAAIARRLAAHVERGAGRLPFATKCLPRAMALCWLLRREGIAYALKIAARPAAARHANLLSGSAGGEDDLHAWVEAGNATVIGDLPGPWLVLAILHG